MTTDLQKNLKEQVYNQIENYKNGTDKEKKIAEKLEIIANKINCFQCLDTQQSWYYREQFHKIDGKGDYYKMTCSVCSSNRWIEDSHICDLYGIFDIKLFNRDSQDGSERIKELEKRAFVLYPELNFEPPTYKKIETRKESLKKSTYKLDLEIGSILNNCLKICRAYFGDIPSIVSLISKIQLNIENVNEDNNKEEIICEEVDSKKFIYIKIENKSRIKEKSILGIYKYSKYKLDVDIHFTLLEPDNDTAYKNCKEIINKIGTKEMEEVIKIFTLIITNEKE